MPVFDRHAAITSNAVLAGRLASAGVDPLTVESARRSQAGVPRELVMPPQSVAALKIELARS